MTRKILVTGATGNIGAQLVPRLTAENTISVRVFVRDAEKAAGLKEAGAEIATGTFEDSEAVSAAVKDVDTVVLITAPNPEAHTQAMTVLNAAREKGVRKIVRISALKASADGPTENTRLHGATDPAIINSGLTYVILRPHFFMQNLFMAADTIAADGSMYMGMGEGRLGLIDVRDIVDCAHQCVISNEFDNQIFNPTGPSSITFSEIAKTLGAGIGKEVKYVSVTPEAVEQSIVENGWGEWFGAVMKDYSKAYSENWGDFTTDDVQKITGHSPRSFQDFTNDVLGPALGGGSS